MDHKLVVAQEMTERYFLNELDSSARNEFEEHYFNCPECAAHVYAGAVLVEEIENGAIPDPRHNPMPAPVPTSPRWLAWLRPALVPVMATLLAVVGYQNLKMVHQLNNPQVLPWAVVNVDTLGSNGAAIPVRSGQSFAFILRVPREGYARYIGNLYDPAGKLEGPFTIQASSSQDQYLVLMPAAQWKSGVYTLKVQGVTSEGEVKDVGQRPLELQTEK